MDSEEGLMMGEVISVRMLQQVHTRTCNKTLEFFFTKLKRRSSACGRSRVLRASRGTKRKRLGGLRGESCTKK